MNNMDIILDRSTKVHVQPCISPSQSCQTFWWMLTLSYTHIQCPPLTTFKYRASVVSCQRYCHALLYDTHTPAWFSIGIAYSES